MSHRGAHPEDAGLFAPSQWPALQQAVQDLSWLLTRGYGRKAAVALVGDRYQLRKRQRAALDRTACSDQARDRRLLRCAAFPQRLLIDGFNVVTTVEAALGGGVVLGARDSCYRDLASFHGTYRTVEETVPAARLVGELLDRRGVRESVWLLDRPVSNSGRLAGLLRTLAAKHGWNWEVRLVNDPDGELVASDEVVATSDSGVLDRARGWVNLARQVVDEEVAGAWLVPMG